MKKETYEPTEFAGIKRRISDGKYIVTVDYGRTMREDKKTGQMKMMQNKTTRVFSTLKEAKSFQGKNANIKERKKVSATSHKIGFTQAMKDYQEFNYPTLTASARNSKQTEASRMMDYFVDRDIRKIDTLDIEKYFRWCQEPHENWPTPLSTNSLKKVKSHMSGFWSFLKKNPTKYGIYNNVVSDASYGKVKKYVAVPYSVEELKAILQYTINNEADYFAYSLVALSCLAGLRRGEICGLQWKDIDFDKKLIDVRQQREEVRSKIYIKVPKNGHEDGETRAERKQRYVGIPDVLAWFLKAVKEQQEEYLHRPVNGEDYVYNTKRNLINGILPRPGKVSKRFSELINRMNRIRIKQELEPLEVHRLHDMRHSYISMLLNGGINPLQVSASVGHSHIEGNTTTTVKVYWHEDEDRTAINEFIDKTFSGLRLERPDLRETYGNEED